MIFGICIGISMVLLFVYVSIWMYLIEKTVSMQRQRLTEAYEAIRELNKKIFEIKKERSHDTN